MHNQTLSDLAMTSTITEGPHPTKTRFDLWRGWKRLVLRRLMGDA